MLLPWFGAETQDPDSAIGCALAGLLGLLLSFGGEVVTSPGLPPALSPGLPHPTLRGSPRPLPGPQPLFFAVVGFRC